MKKYLILLIIVLSLMFSTSCSIGSSENNESNEDYITEQNEFDVYSVEMHSVDSSCFTEIGYDEYYEKLVVRFRDNCDPLYVYDDFSVWEYEKFVNADSLGTYYNEYIKGKYGCTKYD